MQERYPRLAVEQLRQEGVSFPMLNKGPSNAGSSCSRFVCAFVLENVNQRASPTIPHRCWHQRTTGWIWRSSPVSTIDIGACVEPLRNVGLSDSSQHKPAGILSAMNAASDPSKATGCARRSVFVLSSSPAQTVTCLASIARLSLGIENNAGLLDAVFFVLLHVSCESFASKLLSGPSLLVERHNGDEGNVV